MKTSMFSDTLFRCTSLPSTSMSFVIERVVPKEKSKDKSCMAVFFAFGQYGNNKSIK